VAPKPLQESDPARIGRYRLTARLGAGGMGVVYLAQAGDGRQLAVKVLRPEYADDPEFRARFRREVAAMTRVRNRYTVQVLDADTESAEPFLATEFADGPSLDEHVRARGPLHSEATIRLAAALAEALTAIHAAGVTHRDLKPSNVLLTGRGPMVIDFGIAQVADSASITRTGMAIGSPGYMAPEQLTGRAGREADIFTWALVVAFAASGQPPFGTGPAVAILQRILNGRPDISAVPPLLVPLVQAALARDPQRRPDAADLLRELSPGPTAPVTAPSPAGMTMAAGTTMADPAAPGGQTRLMPGGGFAEPAGAGGQGLTRTRYDGLAVPAGARTPDGPGPRRRWFGPAFAVAAIVAVLAGVGAALLLNGGSQQGSAGARRGRALLPGTTAPALSGTARRAGTGTGLLPGAVRRRRRPHAGLDGLAGQAGTQASGSAGNGTGASGSGPNASQEPNVPATTPAAAPAASPGMTSAPASPPAASPGPSAPAASGASTPAPAGTMTPAVLG
jgi:predicted Ser/Thr protein kinase